MLKNKKYIPENYYTYLLCYESKVPFYIGKGKGKRAYQHIKYAIRDNAQDIKAKVIRDIMNKGKEIIIIYDSQFNNETDAFNREQKLIQYYKVTGLLTNKSHNNYPHDFKKHIKMLNTMYYPKELIKQKYIEIGTCKQLWDNEEDDTDINIKDKLDYEYYLFYKKIFNCVK